MKVWMLLMVIFAENDFGQIEAEAYGRPFHSQAECLRRIEQMEREEYPAEVFLTCRSFDIEQQGALVL